MHNAGELEWGIRDICIKAPAIWGARVLVETGRYGKQTFSLLWDRQGAVGTAEDRQALQEKLRGAANALLDYFERELSDDDETHQVTLHGVKFWYSTKRSCGYVYVTGVLA